jgi:hypothetical protein
LKDEDEEDDGIGAIFNGLRKNLGTTSAVVIFLTALSIFVLRTSEYYGPLARPFLVGRWESTTRQESEPRPIVLTLYDDGVASLDGLKGTWEFADISRLAVRIEIPGRDSPSKMYEFQVRLGKPLWGTMNDSGKVLKFKQMEQGGAVRLAAEGVEAVIQGERKRMQELAEKACQETGWRKALYRAYYWSHAEEPLDCSIVGQKNRSAGIVPRR